MLSNQWNRWNQFARIGEISWVESGCAFTLLRLIEWMALI